MKKILSIFLALALIFSFTGCGVNNNIDIPSQSKEIKFDVKDLKSEFKDTMYDGEKFVSFNYTNNSKFTVVNVGIKMGVKSNMSENEKNEFKDEYDFNELFIVSENEKITAPNTSANMAVCRTLNTYAVVSSSKIFNHLEPVEIIISFIDDNKLYKINHNYKEDITIMDSKIETANQWIDNEQNKKIPKPDTRLLKLIISDADKYWIDCLGITKSYYLDYVNRCKQKGYVIDNMEYDKWYRAKNTNGDELSLNYDVLSEEMSVHLNINNAEDKVNFKEALDSYEKFINEYVEFMKKYNSAEDTSALLADYTKYLNQYTETMNKISKMDTSTMTTEDLAYYMEVTNRINAKLLEAMK